MWLGNHRQFKPVPPALQLLNGRRTEGITGGQHDPVAVVFIPVGHLRQGGCLAHTVDPHHQGDPRPGRTVLVAAVLRSRQHLDHRFAQTGQQLIRGPVALPVCFSAKRRQQVLTGLYSHIGHQHLVFHLFVNGFIDFPGHAENPK